MKRAPLALYSCIGKKKCFCCGVLYCAVVWCVVVCCAVLCKCMSVIYASSPCGESFIWIHLVWFSVCVNKHILIYTNCVFALFLHVSVQIWSSDLTCSLCNSFITWYTLLTSLYYSNAGVSRSASVVAGYLMSKTVGNTYHHIWISLHTLLENPIMFVISGNSELIVSCLFSWRILTYTYAGIIVIYTSLILISKILHQ